MKKRICILLILFLVLSLAACGGKDTPPAGTNPPTESVQEDTQQTAGGIKPAKNGILTIRLEDAAVVIKGTAVPMPYRLDQLEAAGVPGDEARAQIQLAPGSTFSANLFLDGNEDYLLSPAYSNEGEEPICLADAQAQKIAMATYCEEPVDQDVSILGIPFGMTKAEVLAMLGEPRHDSGDYLQWRLYVSDADFGGSFYVYFTGDADDSVVSQIDLTLTEK